MFVNTKLCSECGGYCCKTVPGTNSPTDFKKGRKALEKDLIKYLECKLIIINEYKDSYFVRPLSKDELIMWEEEGHVYNLNGECIYFNPYLGCLIPYDERPYSCRMLVPGIDDKGCLYVYGGGIEEVYMKWKPYKDMLLRLKFQYQKN